MSESTSCSVAGAYHLHVDCDDEHASYSTNSMTNLDISPIEQRLEVEKSNDNLLEDFQISEFDSFIFETPDDNTPNDVVWKGLDSFSYEHFLFDLLETNKSLLQPKASNDCPEAVKEDEMFKEKEIDEVMHRQENSFEEDSVNNQEEEKDLHIFYPPTNLFHYLL